MSLVAIEHWRARVVDLAVEFEDANRRGDQFIAIEEAGHELTDAQIAIVNQADDDYNRVKAELFVAVAELKDEAVRLGVEP